VSDLFKGSGRRGQKKASPEKSVAESRQTSLDKFYKRRESEPEEVLDKTKIVKEYNLKYGQGAQEEQGEENVVKKANLGFATPPSSMPPVEDVEMVKEVEERFKSRTSKPEISDVKAEKIVSPRVTETKRMEQPVKPVAKVPTPKKQTPPRRSPIRRASPAKARSPVKAASPIKRKDIEIKKESPRKTGGIYKKNQKMKELEHETMSPVRRELRSLRKQAPNSIKKPSPKRAMGIVSPRKARTTRSTQSKRISSRQVEQYETPEKTPTRRQFLLGLSTPAKPSPVK